MLNIFTYFIQQALIAIIVNNISGSALTYLFAKILSK
jgi:hypothetical protein